MPEAETESILSAVPESEVGSDEEVEVESEADVAPAMIRRSARIQEGFISLDMVNVREVITIKSCVMKVPPTFLRGTRRQSSEKPVVGQVEQVCQRTVAGFCWGKAKKRRRMQQGYDRGGDGAGWTMWRRGLNVLRR